MILAEIDSTRLRCLHPFSGSRLKKKINQSKDLCIFSDEKQSLIIVFRHKIDQPFPGIIDGTIVRGLGGWGREGICSL